MAEPTRRHATLAIIGLPNAGKSTLLNALLGQKLAATSQIPQTTRTRVLGVVDRGDVQLAFLDTPGIRLPKHALNERMMAHVEQALEEADLLLWVVDADDYLGTGEHALAKRLRKLGRPTYLLLNKIDLLSKGRLLEKIATYKDLLPFKEIVPIGAKMGLNLDPLWTILERDAAQPGWLHDEEVFTDQTERSLASEFIREKVLRTAWRCSSSSGWSRGTRNIQKISARRVSSLRPRFSWIAMATARSCWAAAAR